MLSKGLHKTATGPGHLAIAHVVGLPPAEHVAITSTGGFVDIPSPQLESAQSAKARITALLGGRAAEKVVLTIVFNGSGLGPNSDLKLATRLAAQAKLEWGLGDQRLQTPFDVSKANEAEIALLDEILKTAEQNAIEIIQEHRKLTEDIAKALMEHRELAVSALRSLLEP